MWMSFIFIGSTKLLSSQHTSRFIGPFLRWIDPSITDIQLKQVQYFIRKCGHVSEYAVLAVLAWNARRGAVVVDRAVFRRCAIFALMFAAFYAATDEFHQSFEPSREASVLDVFIDTCGAGAGLFLIWLACKWRRVW